MAHARRLARLRDYAFVGTEMVTGLRTRRSAAWMESEVGGSMHGPSKRVAFGDAIPSIVRWGHSPDSDLVYRALLMLGPRPARDIGRTLGLSPGRLSAALDELVAVGAVLLGVAPGRDEQVWSARSPATVLESLRSKHAQDSAVRSAVGLPPPVATVTYAREHLGDGLIHLPSRAAARRRLADLARTTRHEHLAMNTEMSFDPTSARSAVPVDRALLDRGVTMRVLGRQSTDERDPLLGHGRRPDEPGPDYRQAPCVPMKLIVIDRRVALFPVSPHNFDRGYLEVSQAAVVSALVNLFDREWDSARPPRSFNMSTIILDDRERALIALLAQGHTDVSAARELQVSARTVSNILRTLMDRVGVENRFQLGLALGAAQAAPSAGGDR
ncbi:LuxR C-terminal-related transcriptional regulator [Micromonospora sp. NPDC003816]|uniref:helix-turn-helix transcriptional regulator n=1 Tax=Micromonospora sp. NPDC003816 TaxID=3364224 RepID=UPI0036B69C6F